MELGWVGLGQNLESIIANYFLIIFLIFILYKTNIFIVSRSRTPNWPLHTNRQVWSVCNISVCEIQSWFPVVQRITLSSSRTPSDSTTSAKGSTATTWQMESTTLYKFPDTWLCNIFKLGRNCRNWFYDSKNIFLQEKFIEAACGNYSTLSISGGGGVVAVHVMWCCNLDWNFQENFLPK